MRVVERLIDTRGRGDTSYCYRLGFPTAMSISVVPKFALNRPSLFMLIRCFLCINYCVSVAKLTGKLTQMYVLKEHTLKGEFLFQYQNIANERHKYLTKLINSKIIKQFPTALIIESIGMHRKL